MSKLKSWSCKGCTNVCYRLINGEVAEYCKWQKVNAKSGLHGCGHRFGLIKAEDDNFCSYGEHKGE